MNPPTVISTFAGCGGSSLGYKLAGFHELLAVEWDQNAVDTFRLNFPGVPVFHGDIAKLSGAECMRLAGIGPGELDVFDGSPPCQGFSTAGKRKFDDPRNSLFKEFARLLRELQPRVFVMENVTGMVKGAMKQSYLTIIAELRACGYRCKGEVMNAMYYNVPQSRERVIIIGVRNDLGIDPTHPKPQTRPMTVRDAIGAFGSYWNSSYKWTIKTGAPFAAFTKTKGKSHMVQDATGVRFMTQKEMRIAGSFPESFQFTDDNSACERIGNSVPPNLMRAIAEHIKDNILAKP